MKHSSGHILEMSWSYATEWIRGVHMFQYRLLHDLPEDKMFVDKVFRNDIDFHCYLISLRRLERATIMAFEGTDDSVKKQKLKQLLDEFKKSTPYLAPLRNVGEHFDDYLFQKGKNKSVDSRGIRVYSIEFNPKKSYKLNWLGYEVDLDQSSKAADNLYDGFIKYYKSQSQRKQT